VQGESITPFVTQEKNFLLFSLSIVSDTFSKSKMSRVHNREDKVERSSKVRHVRPKYMDAVTERSATSLSSDPPVLPISMSAPAPAPGCMLSTLSTCVPPVTAIECGTSETPLDGTARFAILQRAWSCNPTLFVQLLSHSKTTLNDLFDAAAALWAQRGRWTTLPPPLMALVFGCLTQNEHNVLARVCRSLLAIARLPQASSADVRIMRGSGLFDDADRTLSPSAVHERLAALRAFVCLSKFFYKHRL
jgi:hypothetical protein